MFVWVELISLAIIYRALCQIVLGILPALSLILTTMYGRHPYTTLQNEETETQISHSC